MCAKGEFEGDTLCPTPRSSTSTLVDTNYHHTLAWSRSFGRYDVWPELWRIHRAIGMGGDQLVPAVAGEAFERSNGEGARDAWVEEFDRLIDDVRVFDGVERLLSELIARGFKVVLASSGKPKHVDHFMDLFNGRDHCDAWTTSEDVESTKPAPDLMQVALDKVGGTSGVAIGDSVWDFVAAEKLSLPGIGLRTGGFSAEELTAAGAERVYDSLTDLFECLDRTALRRAG